MDDTTQHAGTQSDADLTPPPADTGFQPAEPIKDTGVEFQGEAEASQADGGHGLKDKVQGFTSQAGEQARGLFDQGKERATGALDQLAHMLTDAAQQVDDKLGGHYGQYARTAAEQVNGFAEQIRAKQADELLNDARELVRKSPAVAVGTAAALGFVIARLVSAGLDQRATSDQA